MWGTVREELCVGNCEGGTVCGELRGKSCVWGTVREELCVGNCEGRAVCGEL